MFGFKNKQRQIFNELAMPLMDSLYGTALKLTHNEEDAEDLIQDTFLKAYKYFDSFEQGTNFKAWIFKIMTRLFYDHYKAKKQRMSRTTEVEDIENFKSQNREEIEGERVILAAEIEYALNQLSDDFRLPVVLSDIQGFSYQEIAEVLDCPVGTVMSRLYRGRKKLKEILVNMQQNTENIKIKDSGIVIPF